MKLVPRDRIRLGQIYAYIDLDVPIGKSDNRKDVLMGTVHITDITRELVYYTWLEGPCKRPDDDEDKAIDYGKKYGWGLRNVV